MVEFGLLIGGKIVLRDRNEALVLLCRWYLVNNPQLYIFSPHIITGIEKRLDKAGIKEIGDKKVFFVKIKSDGEYSLEN